MLEAFEGDDLDHYVSAKRIDAEKSKHAPAS